MSNRKWESDMANEKFEERHIICEVRSKSLDRAKVKGLLLELVGPAPHPLPRQPTPITRSDRVKGYRGRGVSDADSGSVPFVGADR
jgi:hypothetical protein